MKTLAPAVRLDDRLLQAMGLMCVYVGLIVYVNACGKVMAESYHPFEVTLFRHGIAFLWMLILFAPRHGPRILVPKRPGLQIIRGLCGISSSLFYFTGLTQLSLATAAAIKAVATSAAGDRVDGAVARAGEVANADERQFFDPAA